jgi:plasmid stability protein
MSSVTIRDLSPDLHKKLKERARQNRRSLNAELLVTLEQSIRAVGVRPSNEEIAARAAESRARMKQLGITFTDEEITRYKNMGRP